MGRIDDFAGKVSLEICGTLPESFLNACALSGIELWKLQCIDEFTLKINAAERDLPELERLAVQTMCSLRLLGSQGGSQHRRFLKRRLWLMLFLLFVLGLLLLSSLYIWEIEIHGNEKLSRQQILRELADCGVSQGTYWPNISADLVRSSMLIKIPELSWMTININGSRAVVLVKERMEKPEIYKQSEPQNVVASQSGIIKNISVLNGQSLVTSGQTVSKGQLLVSGAVEGMDGEYKTLNARAVVRTQTCHEIKAVYPSMMEQKSFVKSSRQRFALIFGKKRINLYLNSRNTMDDCDKIITEYNLGLSGLFALPITVIREELSVYKKQEHFPDLSELISSQQIEKLSARIDGNIEYSSFSCVKSTGISYVTIYAQCLEDIAKNVKIQ